MYKYAFYTINSNVFGFSTKNEAKQFHLRVQSDTGFQYTLFLQCSIKGSRKISLSMPIKKTDRLSYSSPRKALCLSYFNLKTF